jgi:hypothetical protein
VPTCWSELEPLSNIDTTKLERAFEEKKLAVKEKGPASQVDKKQNLRRVPVETLDNKTWQNLAIAFSRLAHKPGLLLDRLLTLEDFPESLTHQELKSLFEIVADEQKAKAIHEVRKWRIAESELETVDRPERVLWVLAHVPHVHAKLQCGALMTGPVREQITEALMAGQRVSAFCSRLRSSDLLRKCISISLLFGNVLNSATNRANAVGVVLPESLRKLADMRATKGSNDALQDGRELSCLDFVAEALVKLYREAHVDSDGADVCCAEAEALLAVARACLWVSVSLEEASTNLANAGPKSISARTMLDKVPQTPQVIKIGNRVRTICEDVSAASKVIAAAKADLVNLQKWYTMKLGTKNEEWFKDWAAFFEQIVHALDRVRVRATAPKPAEQVDSTAGAPGRQLIVPTNAADEGASDRSPAVPSPCRAGARPPRTSMTARAARRLRESATGCLEEDSDCQSDVSDWGSS